MAGGPRDRVGVRLRTWRPIFARFSWWEPVSLVRGPRLRVVNGAVLLLGRTAAQGIPTATVHCGGLLHGLSGSYLRGEAVRASAGRVAFARWRRWTHDQAR